MRTTRAFLLLVFLLLILTTGAHWLLPSVHAGNICDPNPAAIYVEQCEKIVPCYAQVLWSKGLIDYGYLSRAMKCTAYFPNEFNLNRHLYTLLLTYLE